MSEPVDVDNEIKSTMKLSALGIKRLNWQFRLGEYMFMNLIRYLAVVVLFGISSLCMGMQRNQELKSAQSLDSVSEPQKLPLWCPCGKVPAEMPGGGSKHCIAILIPMYKSAPFMSDLVESIVAAINALGPDVQAHIIFRHDNSPEVNESERKMLTDLFSKHPNICWSSTFNEKNLGVVITRLNLLKDMLDLLKSKPDFQTASRENKLHLLFIDNDDIPSPGSIGWLLRASIYSGADIMSAEPTIQIFNSRSMERLDSLKNPNPLSEYFCYKCTDNHNMSSRPRYNKDGTLLFDPEESGLTFFCPIMVNCNAETIGRAISNFSYYIDTSLMDLIMLAFARNFGDPATPWGEANLCVIVPLPGASPLYLYRQHPGSLEHQINQILKDPLEFFEKINKAFSERQKGNSDQWDFYVSHLSDFDRESISKFLASTSEKDSKFSHFKKLADSLLQQLKDEWAKDPQ